MSTTRTTWTTRIHLIVPHSAQQQVTSEARRYNVVACGRRWGKTTLGIDRLIHPALMGKPVAYFIPTYKMLAEVWRETSRILSPIVARVSAQQNRLELTTGGIVDMWSLERESVRGRKYARVVIDEAAMVRDLADVWQAVIRPTLTDYRGDAWMLSTPRGRNFFWECFQRGMGCDPQWRAWQMPTSTNLYISPEEIDAARQELPRVVFEQEYLAQFVKSDTAVFDEQDIANAADGAVGEQTPHRTGAYLTSIDVGRRQDATVINVFDVSVQPMQRVYHERLERLPYPVIQQYIEAVWHRYGGALVIESNGVGDPLIENLSVPAEPFVTSSKSKVQAIQALQLLLEQGALKAVWTEQERRELMGYQWDDRNLVQDCVMSLAIGAYHLTAAPHETHVIRYADDIPGISGW